MEVNPHSPNAGKIRILIVDDHPQIRESLQALFETKDGLAVIGQARNGQEALVKCAELMPDVILMDLEMPVMDGLTATRMLQRQEACPAIIILSAHTDPGWIDKILQAGACAFVSKTDGPDRIIQAIRHAALVQASRAAAGKSV